MASTQNTYILVINGKPEGPFTVDELRSRQIKPGDFVKTGDMPDYKEAREVAELRELLGFKNEAFLQYYASFDQRAVAAVLDWVFVGCTCILLLFVALLFIEKQLVVFALILALLIIVPIVYLIYHMVMESSAKQATFGKRIIKIKVCDMQGNRLSFAHAAGRNLAKVLSVGTLAIGYLYAFFNKQQQCLHDKIAGTLVIKDRL